MNTGLLVGFVLAALIVESVVLITISRRRLLRKRERLQRHSHG